MKKIYLFVLISIILLSRAEAQCFKIDSLQRVLYIVKSDTDRINTRNLLANEYLINQQPAFGLLYAQQTAQYARTKNYAVGIADAQIIIGDVYSKDQLKYEEALKNYEEALALMEASGNKAKLAYALKKIGFFYYSKFYVSSDYYQKSLEYYLRHLEIVKDLQDKKQMADAYDMVGELYSQLHDEEKGLQFFLRAVDLRKKLRQDVVNDSRLLANAQRFYQLRVENQKLYNYILIGSLLLLGLVIGLMFLNSTQKIRTNRLLHKQKDEIQVQKEDIEEKNRELEKQTLEIVSQRDQIALQRDQLAEQNRQIRLAEEKLKQINEGLKETNVDLEEVVKARTNDLMKTNEALSSANEELDLLIYRASHDFKGPLATLTGLAQVAKIECMEAKAIEFFNKIEGTADKMDGMLTKLTQVSYIIGKIPDNHKISFQEILEKTKNSLNLNIDSSRIDIQLKADLSIPFISDFEVISIIFENLIENALYFSSKNGQKTPQLKIDIDNHVGYLEIDFWDNGMGIRDEYLPKIYDMFFRGSEESKGNGLGLYVVKKAIERLGGEINIQSELNKFTQFTIKLPK